MAGDDMMCDSLGMIVNSIIHEIQKHLSFIPNEYNWPNWVQASLIFDIAVVPCDHGTYYNEELYDLAKILVKECKEHNYKAEYFGDEEKKHKVYEQDLTNTAINIREWIKRYKEYKQY